MCGTFFYVLSKLLLSPFVVTLRRSGILIRIIQSALLNTVISLFSVHKSLIPQDDKQPGKTGGDLDDKNDKRSLALREQKLNSSRERWAENKKSFKRSSLRYSEMISPS